MSDNFLQSVLYSGYSPHTRFYQFDLEFTLLWNSHAYEVPDIKINPLFLVKLGDNVSDCLSVSRAIRLRDILSSSHPESIRLPIE